jgi:hypothetical protein
MIKYLSIAVAVSCIIGFLSGSILKSPKIVKETTIQKDTVRIKDTVNLGDWHTNDSIRQIVIRQGFEINFKLINAYYVKRTYKEGAFFTAIGYVDKDSTLQDLYFTCSEEQHKRLVRQFKRQIGSF